MITRKLVPVCAGITLMSGMFLMGQDTWPPQPPRDRLVFIGWEATDGNMGGLAGADALCQAWAEQCPDAPAGEYKAWLSDDTESPSTRFTKDGQFKLINGSLVARSWADLTDLYIGVPIAYDCDYGIVQGSVWTGTSFDGTPATSAGSCENWSTGDPAWNAYQGSSLMRTSAWTIAGQDDCDDLAYLYCFQQ